MNRHLYIEFLKNEFSYRRAKDTFYSLRNFAIDLELEPGHLSRILRNQRGLSRKKAELIARKLTHLNYSERKRFLRLVSATSGRSKFERNLAKMGLKHEELRRAIKHDEVTNTKH